MGFYDNLSFSTFRRTVNCYKTNHYGVLRLRGGSDHTQCPKSPVKICESLLASYDKILNAFKMTMAEFGIQFEPREVPTEISATNHHISACGAVKCPFLRKLDREEDKIFQNIQIRCACGLMNCPYLKSKLGVATRKELALIENANDDKEKMDLFDGCPIPMPSPFLPPVHWDCIDPLPKGPCSDPSCPLKPPSPASSEISLNPFGKLIIPENNEYLVYLHTESKCSQPSNILNDRSANQESCSNPTCTFATPATVPCCTNPTCPNAGPPLPKCCGHPSCLRSKPENSNTCDPSCSDANSSVKRDSSTKQLKTRSRSSNIKRASSKKLSKAKDPCLPKRCSNDKKRSSSSNRRASQKRSSSRKERSSQDQSSSTSRNSDLPACCRPCPPPPCPPRPCPPPPCPPRPCPPPPCPPRPCCHPPPCPPPPCPPKPCPPPPCPPKPCCAHPPPCPPPPCPTKPCLPPPCPPKPCCAPPPPKPWVLSPCPPPPCPPKPCPPKPCPPPPCPPKPCCAPPPPPCPPPPCPPKPCPPPPCPPKPCCSPAPSSRNAECYLSIPQSGNPFCPINLPTKAGLSLYPYLVPSPTLCTNPDSSRLFATCEIPDYSPTEDILANPDATPKESDEENCYE